MEKHKKQTDDDYEIQKVYKIRDFNDNINLPIYIPIFIKREKFTYDNKVAIPSYHKKWLEGSIDKLNTYITTFSA